MFFAVSRALLEAYKVYRTITTVLDKNIAWEDANITRPDDKYLYKVAALAFELGGIIVMSFMMYYMRRTIETFNRNEFDLIRNNFTTDFYKLQRDKEED